MKVWDCKIGSRDPVNLPSGADSPMRKAIAAAYKELTGTDPEFIFSGWGGGLEERELAVVENRLPVEPAPWAGDGDSQYPTATNGSDKDAETRERALNRYRRWCKAQNEIEALTTDSAALREALEKIYNLPGELNLANYNEDDVRELNENFVAAILTAEQALANRGEAGE